ncbi:putative KRAB box and zinc finger C2H2 type domain containing protein, partial [Operophtera brumata]
MSREECKLERDLCRCCHTEGAFVGLLSTGHTMKKEIEVYTDMLRTCLNIEVMCDIKEDIKEELPDSDGDSYKCTQCDKFYKCRKAVKSHFRIVHLKQKRVNTFPCTQCPKTFISLTRLKTHKLDEHDIDDRLKCNACDKMFNLKRALLKHMNVYHMMGERITCSMCDYECYDKESLRKHLFKHKKSKDYHCQFCKKSFLRKSNLQFHERIHTGDKRKVCAECGQAFVQKASLNYHMAKYHPEVNSGRTRGSAARQRWLRAIAPRASSLGHLALHEMVGLGVCVERALVVEAPVARAAVQHDGAGSVLLHLVLVHLGTFRSMR